MREGVCLFRFVPLGSVPGDDRFLSRGLSLTFANHGHSQTRRSCLDNNRVGCFPLKASFFKCHLNGGLSRKGWFGLPCHRSPCQASTIVIVSLLQLISLSGLDTAIFSLLRPLFLFCCHSALRPPSSPQPLSSQHFIPSFSPLKKKVSNPLLALFPAPKLPTLSLPFLLSFLLPYLPLHSSPVPSLPYTTLSFLSLLFSPSLPLSPFLAPFLARTLPPRPLYPASYQNESSYSKLQWLISWPVFHSTGFDDYQHGY